MRELETARLRLRPTDERDIADLIQLHSDPEVMRYLDPSPVERFIAPGSGFFTAFEKATGRFVGWFVLEPSGQDTYELGYRLHTWAWGGGLGTEGAKALVDLAFTQLGAQRVYAETMAVNTRSRRVMEKAGLRHVRTFFPEWPDPLPGADQGEVEYALTRTEYETQASH